MLRLKLGKLLKIIFKLSIIFVTSYTLASTQRSHLLGRINEVNCVKGNSDVICVAAGFQVDDKSLTPLLVTTHDSGASYQQIKGEYNNSLGELRTANCFKDTDNISCLVGGYLGELNVKTSILLLQSDDGQQWKNVSIPDVKDGIIDQLKCSITTTHQYCVAVGLEKVDQISKPLLIQSSDAGKNWVTMNNLPKSGYLSKISCTPKNTEIYCVAVGFDQEHSKPLMIETRDSGSHWSTIEGQFSLDDSTVFTDADCTSNNESLGCVVVGNAGSQHNKVPIILQTNDGKVWKKTFYDNDNPSFLLSTTCSIKNNNDTICLGCGYFNDLQVYGILIRNVNGGNWDQINGFESAIKHNSVRCYYDGFCISAGVNSDYGFPGPAALWKSLNYGGVWERQAIKDNPGSGNLYTSHCIDNNHRAFCLVAGVTQNFNYQDSPLLVQSKDDGIIWEVKDFC